MRIKEILTKQEINYLSEWETDDNRLRNMQKNSRGEATFSESRTDARLLPKMFKIICR